MKNKELLLSELLIISVTLGLLLALPTELPRSSKLAWVVGDITNNENRVNGIDVSKHNGDIDWKKVQEDNAGYKYAYCRATLGNPPDVDSKFHENMENGNDAGLYMGAYHFAYPDRNKAEDEAKHFVSVIKQYLTEGYLRPALDIENPTENQEIKLSPEELTKWVEDFIETVKKLTKEECGIEIEPIIYCNSYYANNKFVDRIKKYDLWIAHYMEVKEDSKPKTGKWDSWCFWQYSNTGEVSGINGNVDLDYYNGNLDSLKKKVLIPKKPDKSEQKTNGGDPPIYQNIMVFPTPERYLGSDLNNDNDTNDTVLRYKDLETGGIFNTGLTASGDYHSIDIYKNIIVFVSGDSRICYYDIETGTVDEIGVNGFYPSIYENIITFVSQETIHYFNLSTQTLTNTGIRGNSPTIYQNLIAFCAGPKSKSTIWVYDLRTGETVDTGFIGTNPALFRSIIAFETSEFKATEDLNADGDINDTVIRYYDYETHTITNTGAVGTYPSIYGNRIVFATRERDVNQDLNSDGRIKGNVIHYYDLETCRMVNTEQLGTEPDISDNIITFYLWEHWTGRDLNGDGDLSDPIVETYEIVAARTVAADQEVMLLLAPSDQRKYCIS